ncbi:hypothetical protein ABGB08_21575 [Acrocarpospora sp. B8E8]
MSGRWLLIGRYRHTGGLAFYRCYALQTVPLPVLVKAAGTRRRIEEALCATRRSAVSPAEPGGTGGRFLGLMAYPAPKG